MLADAAAETAIDIICGSHVDIKHSKSKVAVFDTDARKSTWFGGTKSNAKKEVGQVFTFTTGGSRRSIVPFWQIEA